MEKWLELHVRNTKHAEFPTQSQVGVHNRHPRVTTSHKDCP
jgi:hypothetical protein